jgi:putative hydrolase of HD superfamily
MDAMKQTQLTNLVYEAATVKRMLRTGWQILGDNEENVGEHTFMTCVIAYFLAKQLKANMETVLVMSVFHDFHEARTGELDKLAKIYTSRDEEKANKHIFADVDDELLSLLTTYEEKKTIEAQIAYEANVIAFSVEVRLLMEKGNVHAKEWMTANNSRLRLPESIALAKDLAETDSQNWWKSIRQTIHEEFAK